MASDKAIRSKSSAQPQPQPHHAKNARVGGPKSAKRRRPNHQFKAQLFDLFQQLNRGYGIALSALDRLEQRGRIFPRPSLHNLSQRTRQLRALANHKLLVTLTGREGQEATRLSRHRARQDKHSTKISG
jgi:hypothetical protein